MTDQKFFAVLANVEAREEPRQSLQDGDKALETLRASRLDIRRNIGANHRPEWSLYYR